MPRERQSEIQYFNMWGGVSRGSVPLLVENALSLAAKSHPKLETWLSDTSCGPAVSLVTGSPRTS